MFIFKPDIFDLGAADGRLLKFAVGNSPISFRCYLAGHNSIIYLLLFPKISKALLKQNFETLVYFVQYYKNNGSAPVVILWSVKAEVQDEERIIDGSGAAGT